MHDHDFHLDVARLSCSDCLEDQVWKVGGVRHVHPSLNTGIVMGSLNYPYYKSAVLEVVQRSHTILFLGKT